MSEKESTDRLDRYCVVCGRTYGPALDGCCTAGSLVATSTRASFGSSASTSHWKGTLYRPRSSTACASSERTRHSRSRSRVLTAFSIGNPPTLNRATLENVQPPQFPHTNRRPEDERQVAGSGDATYHVAISFAGADRAVAELLARALQEVGVTVFYDGFDKDAVFGKNLGDYLAEIFFQTLQVLPDVGVICLRHGGLDTLRATSRAGKAINPKGNLSASRQVGRRDGREKHIPSLGEPATGKRCGDCGVDSCEGVFPRRGALAVVRAIRSPCLSNFRVTCNRTPLTNGECTNVHDAVLQRAGLAETRLSVARTSPTVCNSKRLRRRIESCANSRRNRRFLRGVGNSVGRPVEKSVVSMRSTGRRCPVKFRLRLWNWNTGRQR